MSLYFPSRSWCDALSMIGMLGEKISQKKTEEQSVCQISLSSPPTANAFDMIIMFVYFPATCYAN